MKRYFFKILRKSQGLALFWEATRTLRSKPEMQNIPILAATALFRESDLRSCMKAGCNDYIVKPFTLEQLQREVREFISVPNTTQ